LSLSRIEGRRRDRSLFRPIRTPSAARRSAALLTATTKISSKTPDELTRQLRVNRTGDEASTDMTVAKDHVAFGNVGNGRGDNSSGWDSWSGCRGKYHSSSIGFAREPGMKVVHAAGVGKSGGFGRATTLLMLTEVAELPGEQDVIAESAHRGVGFSLNWGACNSARGRADFARGQISVSTPAERSMGRCLLLPVPSQPNNEFAVIRHAMYH